MVYFKGHIKCDGVNTFLSLSSIYLRDESRIDTLQIKQEVFLCQIKHWFVKTVIRNSFLMKANRRFTKKKALIMSRSDARIAEEHGNSKEITTALTEILIKAGKFQESESSLFAKATYKRPLLSSQTWYKSVHSKQHLMLILFSNHPSNNDWKNSYCKNAKHVFLKQATDLERISRRTNRLSRSCYYWNKRIPDG